VRNEKNWSLLNFDEFDSLLGGLSEGQMEQLCSGNNVAQSANYRTYIVQFKLLGTAMWQLTNTKRFNFIVNTRLENEIR
jgi:hypothetical protein